MPRRRLSLQTPASLTRRAENLARGVATTLPSGHAGASAVVDVGTGLVDAGASFFDAGLGFAGASFGLVTASGAALEQLGARAVGLLPDAVARHLTIGRRPAAPPSALTLASVFGTDLPGVASAELSADFAMTAGEFRLPIFMRLDLRAEVLEGTRLSPAIVLRRGPEGVVIDRAAATLSTPIGVWDPVRAALGNNIVTRSPDRLMGAAVEGVVIDARRAVEVTTRTHAAGVRLPLDQFVNRVSGFVPSAIGESASASAISGRVVDELLARLGGPLGEAGRLQLRATLDLDALTPSALTLLHGDGHLELPGQLWVGAGPEGRLLDFRRLDGELARAGARLGVKGDVGVHLDPGWGAQRITSPHLEISGGGLSIIGRDLAFDVATRERSGRVDITLPPGIDALLESVHLDAARAEPTSSPDLGALLFDLTARVDLGARGVLAPGDFVFPRPGQPPLWLRVFPGTEYRVDARIAPSESEGGGFRVEALSVELSRAVELRNDRTKSASEPRGGLAGLKRFFEAGLRHAVSAGVRRFEMDPESGQLEARGAYRVGGVPLLDVRVFPQGLPLPCLPTTLFEAPPAGAARERPPAIDPEIAPDLARLLGQVELSFHTVTNALMIDRGPVVLEHAPARVSGTGELRLELTRDRVDWVAPRLSFEATPVSPGTAGATAATAKTALQVSLQLPADGRDATWYVRDGKISAPGITAHFAAAGRDGHAEATGRFRLKGPLSAIAEGGRFAFPVG